MKKEEHDNINVANFIETKSKFLNRELSWLEFNSRVLEEACNPSVPLLERVKFLSISASNMDEFYMVRVAGLKEQLNKNVDKKSLDGLTPKQQLESIYTKTTEIVDRQQTCFTQLTEELHKCDIHIVKKEDLSNTESTWLENHFINNIFPVLSPIAVDPAHPFPFLPNLSQALIFKIKQKKKLLRAFLPLPSMLPRLINICESNSSFILLEDVIELFSEQLFPGKQVTKLGTIRVIRDSDLEIEDEAEDLVSHFETAVKKRRKGGIIRLKTDSSLPKNIQSLLQKELNLGKDDLVETPNMLGLSDIIELYNCDRPELKFSPYEERFPERINDYGGNCFAAIAAKDIVIHHPYESFDVVVSFIQQAAKDPDVVAIKQTLYRTSNVSPIVKALIDAAESGKSVTVAVELKARFDEETNLRWAKDLERAGAHVIFGFVNFKTHAKVSLVVRREQKGLKSYVHFGTGNYHPITAKVYSDLSFFTCNQDLCRDVSYLFNYLTGYSPPKELSKLVISPLNMREKLISLINNEIDHAKKGRPASIWAKLNSLIDKETIEALYKASQNNVKITLVVRGICGLKPGIKGLSENITVKSIVGRFLEHSRIVCFGAGSKLPSSKAKLFISSADWMPRNFDRRVEVLVPIENPTVHKQILHQILMTNLKDSKQCWEMNPDGSYTRTKTVKNSLSAHEYFLTNPSLSGRGTALKEEKTINEIQKVHDIKSLPKQ